MTLTMLSYASPITNPIGVGLAGDGAPSTAGDVSSEDEE